MFIILQYTEQVHGNTLKTVECEKCARQFQYEMKLSASATVDAVYGIGAKRARTKAQKKATDLLQRKQSEECDAVPCPVCGWYQSEMVLCIQHNQLAWLGTAGKGLMFLAIVAAALAFMITFAGNDQLKKVSGALAVGAVLLATLGIGALLLRGFFASQHDPNALAQEHMQGR